MTKFDRIEGFPDELKGRINSFITTQFDDSLTVEGQLRVLIKWIKKNIVLTNEMIDYLNRFIENFDEKLYKTIDDVLYQWAKDGLVADYLKDWDRIFQKRYDELDEHYSHQLSQISTIETNKNLEVGGTVRIPFQEKVLNMREFASTTSKEKFRFGFKTDDHFSQMSGHWYTASQYLGLTHNVNMFESLKENVDCYIFGGDNTTGEMETRELSINATEEFCNHVFRYPLNSDRFLLLGNHEEYSPTKVVRNAKGDLTSLGQQPVSMNFGYQFFKDMFRTREKLYGERRNDFDSLYFYKDYDDKKIRLIGLNTNDLPEINNDEGFRKYPPMSNVGLQSKQIAWLSDVALKNVPENYDVIVVSHVPLMNQYLKNGDLVQNILEAFYNKTYYSGSNTTNDDFACVVNVDYTNRSGGTIVGCFAGHYHYEVFDDNPENTKPFKQIVLNCSWHNGSNGLHQQKPRYVADDISKPHLLNPTNTNGEDCWYYIIVDQTQKTVTIKGFDYGNDYSYSYDPINKNNA